MLRNIASFILLILLTWFAWMSWQPPAVIPDAQPVRLTMPEPIHDAKATLWRVMTRRMIWKQAAEHMRKRLEKAGLSVIPITRKEEVELHAFDDARSFDNRKDAARAKKKWKKLGVDASITRSSNRFGVALGRLYLAAYARQLQERLRKSGKKYNYDRHIVHIQTWRFTFSATTHINAEKLWHQVQELGVADPTLIPETQFRVLFEKNTQDVSPQRHKVTKDNKK